MPQLIDLRCNGFDLPFNLVDVLEDAVYGLDDRIGSEEIIPLLQVADLRILRHKKLPFCCFPLAGEHVQKSCFTCPVLADDADLFAGIYGKGCVLKDHIGTVGLF